MTYLFLDLVFLAVAAAVLAVALVCTPDRARLVRRWWLPALVSGVVLLVLTIVFDNAMIAAGLMTYDPHTVSGARIGLVPVEDLAYPVGGLLILTGVWVLLRRRAA
ncbi:lycopene cyclase domain-containing protein [Leifsonia shinshuensis]|uniref:lycopene cyclase domain-containing protein n=1 Tax=Leifsonia shinshuensis TaxID=150026 RepID=UPI001F50C15E|nr:lycopene cyclase domain-containing protein [Leifsonia shinshuensis]MCI0155903.1 lycopene cyclase domain-containing protein [Leifsonia shinshuensis]